MNNNRGSFGGERGGGHSQSWGASEANVRPVRPLISRAAPAAQAQLRGRAHQPGISLSNLSSIFNDKILIMKRLLKKILQELECFFFTFTEENRSQYPELYCHFTSQTSKCKNIYVIITLTRKYLAYSHLHAQLVS